MLFVLGMLVILAVAVVVLEPIVRGTRASLERSGDEMSEAEATRRVRLLALRDAEYDYQMGKLDEADYLEIRAELAAEALEAMEAVEAEKRGVGTAGANAVDRLEAEVAAVRAGLREGTTCGACGHTNPGGSRFCGSCGEALHLSRSASA